MRALVTGGAGFIGSALVDRLLAEGHEVDVLDDLSTGSLARLAPARAAGRTFSFHKIDVCQAELPALVAHRRPEVVFHLVDQTSPPAPFGDPARASEVSLVGSLRVLEGARAAGTRKVVFAMRAADYYGELESGATAHRESDTPHPSTALGVARRAVLEDLGLYRERYGLEFSALALASVYGPGASGEQANVVATFAKHLRVGGPLVISGDGSQTRDFVYVDDVVDALVRAAARGSGLLMNIGTGIATTIADLAWRMAALAGVRVPIEHGPARTGDLRQGALDVSRASLHLGWRPFTALDEGLAAVLGATVRPLVRGAAR